MYDGVLADLQAVQIEHVGLAAHGAVVGRHRGRRTVLEGLHHGRRMLLLVAGLVLADDDLLAWSAAAGTWPIASQIHIFIVANHYSPYLTCGCMQCVTRVRRYAVTATTWRAKARTIQCSPYRGCK